MRSLLLLTSVLASAMPDQARAVTSLSRSCGDDQRHTELERQITEIDRRIAALNAGPSSPATVAGLERLNAERVSLKRRSLDLMTAISNAIQAISGGGN